jgi:hypothetical protein
MTFILPVTGVPFINQTRASKTISLIERSQSKLVVEVVVETFDAPYCDSFVCKECWVLIGSEANELQQRSILTQFYKVDFSKYTIFKKTI